MPYKKDEAFFAEDLQQRRDIDPSKVLACPKCGAPLGQNEGVWACPRCSASYQSSHGLVRINPSTYYWGEIPREAMLRTLDRARRSSCRQAVAEVAQETGWLPAPRYIFSPGRVDWFPEVPCRRGMRILDMGSGWGNLAFLLSQHFDEVYSLEGILERADFQQIRREQDGVHNLFVVNSDLTVLPFQPATFDLVVLNGVLEWMGLADIARNPREVQLSVLRGLGEILRPGGYLYIGTEARVSYAAMKGARDHSGLPYTSLLPRPLADLVMRWYSRAHHRTEDVTPRSYRTYTYTPRAYGRLLAESGYSNTRISWVVPTYNRPCYSAPFECPHALRFHKQERGERRVKKRIESALFRAATYCGLERYLMSTLSIVASAQGNPYPTLLESVCLSLQQRGFRVSASQSLRCTPVWKEMNTRTKIRYILFNLHTHRPEVMLKFPRTRESVEVFRREERSFTSIAARCPGLAEVRGAHYLSIEGFPVLCERFFAGTAFRRQLGSEQAYAAVMHWLAQFQASAQGDSQTMAILPAAGNAVERLSTRVGVEQQVREFLQQWLDATSKFEDTPVPSVPVHGDFTINNTLLSPDEVFITDWEWARPQGAPWEDFWTFIMSCALNTSPDGTAGQRKPENLVASLQGDSANSRLVRLAAESFLNKSNLPRNALVGGFLPTVACRALRDLDDLRRRCDQSVFYQFLSLAARRRLPLWDAIDRLLPPRCEG